MGILGRGFAVVMALTAGSGWQYIVADRHPDDGFMALYQSGDLKFVRAVWQARATVARFFELAAAGTKGGYFIKVMLVSEQQEEHIWASVESYRDGVFRARLANEPMTPSYSFKDLVEVPIGKISDWMVETGEVRYGAYTLRLLFDDASGANAESLRQHYRD